MVLHRKVNIIITGTPGTGKSSHAQLLHEQLPELELVNILEVAKENNCITGYDEARKSQIVDEDRVVDALEDRIESGGLVIDWHVCDAFPESQIDLVVVLRASTDKVYDRLKERGYADDKIQENLDAEIMEIVLNDAREQYDEDAIVELESNEASDVQSNVDRIVAWYNDWRDTNPRGVPTIQLPQSDSSDSSDDDNLVPALKEKAAREKAEAEAKK